ncbi:hypothetical protein NQ314_010595 [Rhamnusium bicolor]|uniref:PiggyBac transposable element-derived protein domain-containing protein n=1 Tax=Rhamnusium bicolor TaxID=1586634 RepID=A0AAV8XQR0_9CUCU|nr:hypothetical protein NQ314_010595 [Rhamnusium bicolor]
MGKYEREQKRLEAMWNDILSDEESDISEFGDVYLSDEYASSRDSLSANSDSDSDVVAPKKRSKFDLTATDDGASTSGQQNVYSTTVVNNVDQVIENIIAQYAIEDNNNEEDIEFELDSLTWTPVDGSSLKQFTFTVNDVWIPTNNIEMERFFGMLLWMGLCNMPTLRSYWEKNSMYANQISKTISRNRFELLLKMWHFSDNEDVSLESDRLRKLTPLINKLIERFQEVSRPGLKVCIDETMVPFRGRLRFRQFIKNKRHKFDIKLYKLCTEGGYTFNVKVYCGSDIAEGGQASSNVVFSLTNNLLDFGRQLFTDNYYTSVSLATELLKRNTHLISTLCSNRKYNPKEVVRKKFKQRNMCTSGTGIVVLEWRDKRDVLMLSTVHKDNTKKIKQRGGEIE